MPGATSVSSFSGPQIPLASGPIAVVRTRHVPIEHSGDIAAHGASPGAAPSSAYQGAVHPSTQETKSRASRKLVADRTILAPTSPTWLGDARMRQGEVTSGVDEARRSGGRVVLAEPRSFCAGVVQAIGIVDEALRQYTPPIYVRKEIVHNHYVV